ncbi:MAG TPA: YihY/virulence factor BrkB family protein [Candidatus Polarisedimenticolia bacterium]|nr:YihY/virulence factor BrkB family protein [Candidatus Polarisedimenticolia bacterium]
MRKSPSLARFIMRVLREADSRRITGLAAEAAFFTVLGLFPGLLIVATALGWLEALAGRDIAGLSQQAVLAWLDQVLTDRASTVHDAVRELFSRESPGLLTTATLIAVWTLGAAFTAIIEALVRIYGVSERRSWLSVRLTGIALAVGSVVMLAVFLALMMVGPLMGAGHTLAGRLELGPAFRFTLDWLRGAFAFVLLVAWATTLYHLALSRRTRWVRDLPGGILAALLWLGMSHGFRLYISLAAGVNHILGLLGGGLILLVWLYLLCLALLVGGVVNAELARSPRDAT